MTKLRFGVALLVILWLPARPWADTPDDSEPLRTSAQAYLATVRPSPELQAFLDESIDALIAADSNLRRATLYVALLDLTGPGPLLLAHHNGYTGVYPASVVKFVYLMATYAWQEQGKLQIDDELDRLLVQMAHHSSNRATQQVLRRLTGTQAGPELPSTEYEEFKAQRMAVKQWLRTLGVTDLHCVHPTYDGGGDFYGRDVQFLKDPTVDGALGRPGEYRNRQAMTAVATAELLALLATHRALSPESSAAVRHRMRHDPKEQPYLVRRIAGGAARMADLEVYSKTGTWGPIFADAGVIRDPSGRELVLVVFIESRPAYRGNFIADLAHRSAAHLLRPSTVGS